MRVVVDRVKGILQLNGFSYPISNKVRSLKDGTRKSSEVIYSIPDNKPYDPMPFPAGVWRVTGVEWQGGFGFDPRTYGQVKIRTDAWQMVKVWTLDKDGDYARETMEEVRDGGYLLHYSSYGTTLGCIKIEKSSDAVVIGKEIQSVLETGEAVELEVI